MGIANSRDGAGRAAATSAAPLPTPTPRPHQPQRRLQQLDRALEHWLAPAWSSDHC